MMTGVPDTDTGVITNVRTDRLGDYRKRQERGGKENTKELRIYEVRRRKRSSEGMT